MGDRQTQELGEKGDTDRGLLPLTDQQFRHRRKLHNGFKVLIGGLSLFFTWCRMHQDGPPPLGGQR